MIVVIGSNPWGNCQPANVSNNVTRPAYLSLPHSPYPHVDHIRCPCGRIASLRHCSTYQELLGVSVWESTEDCPYERVRYVTYGSSVFTEPLGERPCVFPAIKAVSIGESMNNIWVRATLVKNLPKTITQHLAVQPSHIEIIDASYNLVVMHLHDHSAGLPRDRALARLHLAEGADKQKDDQERPKTEVNKQETQDKDPWNNGTRGDQRCLNAMSTCDEKGTGKCYGACWHCGGWGHHRRECIELMGTRLGTVNELNGERSGDEQWKRKRMHGRNRKRIQGWRMELQREL